MFNPMIRTRTVAAYAAICLCLATSSCVLGEPARKSDPRLDPTLRLSTYIEEGALVALVVSTRATRLRLDQQFIPIEVAVVNKGLPSLTITPESFALRTVDGREFPVVDRQELLRGYGSTDNDRRFPEAGPAVETRFRSFNRAPSNMFPGFVDGIPRTRVLVARFEYMVDVIYFPRPAGDLHAVPLELSLRAPELDDPVFVRFTIRGTAN
jgi:hypothetical protein